MADEMASNTPPGPERASRETVGPSQQGPPGGTDAPQNPQRAAETVPRVELDKVIAQRQTAKEKVRHLTEQVEQLRARLRAMPGEAELGAFQDWKARLREAGLPPDQQQHDIGSISRRLREPLEARMEALRGRKDALERQLTDLLRDQELRIAAARVNAINPEQVVALLRGRVRMVETPEGRFVPEFAEADGEPMMAGGERVADAQRFVGLFLAMPENANLVRSTVAPGSGARQAGGAATRTDPVPRTRAEFLALPPERRRQVAGRMTRQQRDALLGRGSPDGAGYL
jgi:hypothetical protein